MGKNEQKQIKPKTETPKEVETPQGVTVGMARYKPVPRFKSGCKNC